MSETSSETPWTTEPNESEWVTAAGLRAKALRHSRFLHWCGYVEVPPDHPLYGVGYTTPSQNLKEALAKRLERPLGDSPSFAVLAACVFGGDIEPRPDFVFEVHGGITFSGESYWTSPEAGWWFGFDCGHCDDLSPGLNTYGFDEHGTYRHLPYVIAECERLAEQLAAMGVEVAPEGP